MLFRSLFFATRPHRSSLRSSRRQGSPLVDYPLSTSGSPCRSLWSSTIRLVPSISKILSRQSLTSRSTIVPTRTDRNREDRKDRGKQFQKAKERGPRPGSKVTERTRLSKEEHDRRVAEKLCFNCGLPGHLSNTCTKDRTVRGGSSSGPPGLSSHRMGLGGVLRDLQSLADTTECVDTLTLGSVHLEIALGSNEDDDDWLPGLPLVEDGTNLSELDTDDSDSNENDVPYNHRGRMGDPLARRAEHILHQGCPYPGDNTEDPDCKDRL